MYCEKDGTCDIDQRVYKGVAMSSYARAAAAAAPALTEPITKMLNASAKGAAGACHKMSVDVRCAFSWVESDGFWGPLVRAMVTWAKYSVRWQLCRVRFSVDGRQSHQM